MNSLTLLQRKSLLWSLLLLVFSGSAAIAAFLIGPGHGDVWHYRWGFVGMCGLAVFMLLILAFKVLIDTAPCK